MTIIKTIQLCCDGPGCTEAYQALSNDTDSANRQRMAAVAEGWTVSLAGGMDLCPSCALERHRNPASYRFYSYELRGRKTWGWTRE